MRDEDLKVNGLSLEQVREALNLADLNRDAIKPEYREALQDRMRRLLETERRIIAIQRAR